MIPFPEYIKRLRLNAGQTTTSLAKELGVTNGNISQWDIDSTAFVMLPYFATSFAATDG